MFNDQQRVARSRVWNSNAHVSLRSKRVQSSYCAKVRAEAKKKGSFFPLPLPRHIFFCSCPSFLSKPREETLATQAMLMLTSPCQPKVVFHSFLCLFFLNSNYCCTFTAPPPPNPMSLIWTYPFIALSQTDHIRMFWKKSVVNMQAVMWLWYWGNYFKFL